jgi:hypothetical protein
MPMLIMNGAKLLPSLYVFMAWMEITVPFTILRTNNYCSTREYMA